jgi:hypothetical protein
MTHRVFRRLPLRLLLLPVALAVMVAAGLASPVKAAEPGPEWMSPRDGEQIPYINPELTFRVAPIPNATQYLYGFFENGKMVWENYANERHLDGTTYILRRGSAGHRALGSGANGNVSWPLQLWVRGYVNDGGGRFHWSEASIINVRLVGFGCIYVPSSGACTY